MPALWPCTTARLDNELRNWVEQALHAEALKVVVCTSSLDLGVDFSPVDTVVQVGSPKGVARFMQRAGRSGHHPGHIKSLFCAYPLAGTVGRCCAEASH
jgi:ATP-dependent Lhr-like helicase